MPKLNHGTAFVASIHKFISIVLSSPKSVQVTAIKTLVVLKPQEILNGHLYYGGYTDILGTVFKGAP